jgi:urease accessory protein
MPLDDPLPATRWRARLALGFERRDARSVLASRVHEGPLVVQKALYPEGDAVCHAIVVHPPAGIVGGDELVIDVRAREGASALLTTPGAAKWYRSAGSWASSRVAIDAGPAASVEWLPQETILYDGALADIGWEARVASDARLVAWDIVCLGRSGAGERFANGRCRIESRLYRDGRLEWLERGRIDPGSRLADSPAGLGARSVFGTMIAAAPAIEDEWVARARDVEAREGEGAITRLPGLLVARYRGDSSESARAYFTAIWKYLRAPLTGREAVEPRIWRT